MSTAYSRLVAMRSWAICGGASRSERNWLLDTLFCPLLDEGMKKSTRNKKRIKPTHKTYVGSIEYGSEKHNIVEEKLDFKGQSWISKK